jgi:general stress protein 26
MGNVKDLHQKEAIEKLKEIVEAANTCLFTTKLEQVPLQTRPMSTQEVDNEGCLWFFSDEESHKNMEINQDDRVQLFYANPKGYEFLSIYGEAEILTDRAKIEELWSPMVKTWFQEGKDDPNLSIIKVTPLDAYYWDTKHNKMVSLLKIAASLVSGKTMDDGVEGKLSTH